MKDLVLVLFAVLGGFAIINGVSHSDQHELFTQRYADRTMHTVKTGETLSGLARNDVVLAPRSQDDAIPLFRLRCGKKETSKRLDFGEYCPTRQRFGPQQKSAAAEKSYNFGSFRLPREFGDDIIRIVDLEVEQDDSVTMTYCVDAPSPKPVHFQ